MSANIKIPKTSKQKFWEHLKTRKYEDIEVIKLIEKFLMKKRGYVFKMPKPKSSIILLVSGGIDSTVTWELLLSKYQLKVYPLFLFRDKKRSKKEVQSVDFFSKYFKHKYPSLYQPVMKFSTTLMPPEIAKTMNQSVALYPKRIIEMVKNKYDGPYSRSIFPSLNLFYALLYSQYLFGLYDITVKTIINGISAGDGVIVPGQTLTSLRCALLSACYTTHSYNWQYSSLALEKELGHWLYNQDLIRLGNKLNLPLEKTWSCYIGNKFHCNKCLSCMTRQNSFKKAKVKDTTIYSQELSNFPYLHSKVLTKLYHSVRLNLGIKKALNKYIFNKLK